MDGLPIADTTDHETLPAYSPGSEVSRPSTEHTYALADKTSEAWLTLQLLSRAAAASQLPYIREGDPIAGTVTLDLQDEAKIKNVTVMVWL